MTDDRMEKLEEVCKRRFIYGPSFSLYGGAKGLYDYGPVGAALKNNLIQAWRKHFVQGERLHEISTPILTPSPVLIASGHAAKFGDALVVDTAGTAHRADHLLEGVLKERKDEDSLRLLKRVGELSLKELGEALKQYGVKSLEGYELSEPREYNLMFPVKLGANVEKYNGFLRPETAQGIFVNFSKLLEFNAGKLPFGAATVGYSFRNEIAPRSGLLRTREFEQAEIEYFVNPKDKTHPRFNKVKNTMLTLYGRNGTVFDGKIQTAVEEGLVAHSTLGYFMAQTHLFLVNMGIPRDKIRFRQHLKDEMAHYAVDCWDCEILITGSWCECVGIADRGNYDLTQHSKYSGVKLQVFEPAPVKYFPNQKVIEAKYGSKTSVICKAIDEWPVGVKQSQVRIISDTTTSFGLSTLHGTEVLPITDDMLVEGYNEVEETIYEPNKALIGKKFGRDAGTIFDRLEAGEVKPVDGGLKIQFRRLSETINEFILTPEMYTVRIAKIKQTGKYYTPHVIEPSFGIGRILTAILEHTFQVREDQRTYFAFPYSLAPYHCVVVPLSNKPELLERVEYLVELLRENDVNVVQDVSSTSIGKKYSRWDEIGVPYIVTVDFDSLKDNSFTLRKRDSTDQKRYTEEQLISYFS